MSLNAGLMDKYGIPAIYQNSDGDTFTFNGSTFTRTNKVDDSFDVGAFVKTVAISALTAGVAGALAPALAGALGSAGITVSTATAKGLIGAALSVARGEDIDVATALSLVGGSVLPGGATVGEIAKSNDVVQDVLDAMVSEITNPENYREEDENGETTIVWGGHGGTDEIGNPIVNIPDYSPITDKEDGGAGDSTASSSNSSGTNSSNTGSNTNSQYEVIRKNDDGIVVRDTTDGDIWIIQGDYEIGDFVPEDVMIDAIGGDGEVDGDGSNTTIAGTSGTGTTPTPATPTPPAPTPVEGDACDLGGGDTGVIKDGKCVATTATLPNTGMWPASTSPDNTSTTPSDSNTSTTTTQAPSTTTTTTPSTTPSSSNQPAGEIVGTGVWPASGTGGGKGPGNGPDGTGAGNNGGDSDGDGGDGDNDRNGDGKGLSNLAASRGSSKAHWDRLFAAKEFQSRRGQFGRPTGTSRELNSSNYQMRQNLMNSLWDDLA